MAAAYLVATGEAAAGTAMSRRLAIGPPTLVQFALMRGLGDRTLGKPRTAIAAASRVLDAPARAGGWVWTA